MKRTLDNFINIIKTFLVNPKTIGKTQNIPVNSIQRFAKHTTVCLLKSIPKSHCNNAAASCRPDENLRKYHIK